MSFNVNDKVTVVDSGKTYSTYRDWMEEHGKQWKSQWAYNVGPKNGIVVTIVAKGKYGGFCSDMLYLIQCDDKVYIIGERGIKAVETVGFKVGDVVKVTSINSKAILEKAKHIGAVTKITYVWKGDNVLFPYYLEDTGNYWFAKDELQLVTEKDEVFTLKEAMKQCLDGHKVVPVNHSHPKSHMFFDDSKGFMWYSEPLGYTEKAEAIFSRTQWVLWTEPPKFTKDTLVYNNDGTIGRVVEDKGVYNGIRKYSVSLNAIRDAVKTVDESELTSYESR